MSAASPVSAAPFRAVRLGSRATKIEARSDGTMLLRATEPLAAYPSRLTECLMHWARITPAHVFLAERDIAGQWRKLTYRDAFNQSCAIGQALLDRGLSIERPLAILSDNSIDHALLALGAMLVGVPYAPISPAYSLVSKDFTKLRFVLDLITPGLVYAREPDRYRAALTAVARADREIITGDSIGALTGVAPNDDPNDDPNHAIHRMLVRLHGDTAGDAAGDTIVKFLFTSGSTGNPKAVITTQRMITSNLQMIKQALPFLGDEPPVLVDWLPWNHVFGGSHNFGLVLMNGCTLYIDDGKPGPALIERTMRNLREIAPTAYFNVPKGFEGLVTYLAREPALRAHFFSRLKMLFFAGAALPQHIWDALDRLALDTIGERIMMITGLGATETAPSVTFVNWPGAQAGIIGVPVAGQKLKLVPAGDKTEIRVRGPNVTPGYWRDPALTSARRSMTKAFIAWAMRSNSSTLPIRNRG